MRDLVLRVVCASAVLGAARTASAAPTIALVVEGAHREDAQIALVHGLGAEASIAREAPRAIVAAFGKKTAVSTALADVKTREEAIAKIKNAAPGVDAVVIVVLRRAGDAAQAARIFVVPAHGDLREATATQTRQSSTLLTNVRTELHAATEADARPPAPEPAAAEAAPPPPPLQDDSPRTPPPLATAAPDRDVASEPAARTVGRELFSIFGGIEAGGRRFIWRDALRGGLRDYSLAAAPLGLAEASVYPFARTRISLLADVGIAGEAAHAFALSSSDSAGESVSTTWSRWAVGPRVRLRTRGEPAKLVVTLGADYARETFDLARGATPSTLPSADYRTIRPNALARVAFGRFAILAGAGYRHVLDAGSIGDRFPRASVAGVDGELGGAVSLTHGIELRALARYARFFYTMNAEPADREVAGGAVDQVFGVGGGLAYAY